MEDNTDPFRGKLMPLLGKDYNYFMEMKNRKEYFDLYLEKHNKKNSLLAVRVLYVMTIKIR